MQPKTAAPRAGFTAAQVDAALGYSKGALIQWGVDVYDAAGVARTSTQTVLDTTAEWNLGTYWGTSTSANHVTRP
jgi:hypothetical protein